MARCRRCGAPRARRPRAPRWQGLGFVTCRLAEPWRAGAHVCAPRLRISLKRPESNEKIYQIDRQPSKQSERQTRAKQYKVQTASTWRRFPPGAIGSVDPSLTRGPPCGWGVGCARFMTVARLLVPTVPLMMTIVDRVATRYEYVHLYLRVDASSEKVRLASRPIGVAVGPIDPRPKP